MNRLPDMIIIDFCEWLNHYVTESVHSDVLDFILDDRNKKELYKYADRYLRNKHTRLKNILHKFIDSGFFDDYLNRIHLKYFGSKCDIYSDDKLFRVESHIRLILGGFLMEPVLFDDYIYLHFLDRELRNSISDNLCFNDNDAELIICLSLLMTSLPIYVSFSHMYESLESFPKSIRLLLEFEKLGLCKMITNARNIDEFISSRKVLYTFDKERYGNYFTHADSFWPSDVYVSTVDTTSILRSKMLSKFTNDENFMVEELTYDITHMLISNKHDALTFSFFRKPIQNAYENAILNERDYSLATTNIKQLISTQYSSRYLDEFNGTIITGISGFSMYEFLAKSQYKTNLKLFLEFSRLYMKQLKTSRHIVNSILEFRFSDEYYSTRQLIVSIIQLLEQISNGDVSLARGIVSKFNSQLAMRGIQAPYKLISYFIEFYNYLSLNYRVEVNIMKSKILLVVATQLELSVLLEKMQSKSTVVPFVGKLSYFSSVLNNSIVYVVKSQMGQGGVGGSILTLEESIRNLKPNLVIMGGIAWGANSNRQKIGDVIVSTQIWDYDLVKIGSKGEELFRGAIIPSSPQAVQMFEVVCALKREYRVDYGLIASGSMLLDNVSNVNRLKNEKSELIGGDMESAGMASVCSRNQIQWVLNAHNAMSVNPYCKAICC